MVQCLQRVPCGSGLKRVCIAQGLALGPGLEQATWRWFSVGKEIYICLWLTKENYHEALDKHISLPSASSSVSLKEVYQAIKLCCVWLAICTCGRTFVLGTKWS